MSTFGEELKRERELRRISLREIAAATKISLRHLESLERNDFQHLPGGVFNRGFVRAYAQFIGIDPEAMVNAYLLQEQTQESGADPGVLRSKRVRRDRSAAAQVAEPPARRRPWGRLLAWGLLLLGLIGGLIGGIYYFLQREREATVRDSGRGRAAGRAAPGRRGRALGRGPGRGAARRRATVAMRRPR